MRRLQSVMNDQVELEVIECDCGFHLGLDATYLDQTDDIVIACPACYANIDTAVVLCKTEELCAPSEPKENTDEEPV